MAAVVWELLHMGVFILMVSYGLHYQAYKKGLGDENHVVKPKKDKDGNNKEKQPNPFLKKWLDFGGGYYGIVAFIKLIFIELAQFRDFIANWPGLGEFINSLDLGWLIGFFVEQFKNFIQAIIWPVDYLNQFSLVQCAILALGTYAIYRWSQTLARKKLASELDYQG